MPRFTAVQTNFNAGEWSPLAYGRADIDKYKNALATCKNYIPMAQGGITRRPGAKYIATTKSNGVARLQRFEFSVTQAYVLEFGNNYIRFYTNGGQLLNAGSPYEVTTNYAVADVFNLKFTQSADVLYITHPSYPPAKLQRLGATSWTLTNITFLDGPYLPLNTTPTTLTASGTTGAVTITASSTTGINGGSGFLSSDVGRIIRLKNTTWGYATITGYTSTTVVSATVNSAFGAAAATSVWRIGVWGTANGYPNCVTFHQDRLVFAGCTQYPGRIDGSNTSDYENFAPSSVADVVADNNAFSFTLNSNTVNRVEWMQSDENGLLAGTAGGEWVLAPSSIQAALTATNVLAKNTTSYGVSSVAPVRMGKSLLYVQRTGRKVREMLYSFQLNSFQAQDISLTGEHLTTGGLKQLAAQQAPQPVVWAVRNDGTLVAFSYDRDQQILGWHQHQMGGYSDVAQTVAPLVESVAVIPSPAVSRDDVWVIVNRYVNGATMRSVELLSKFWENGDSINDAVFSDCCANYSGAATSTITGLTWLKGQTVKVLLNGAAHPDCVVDSSGNITLQRTGTYAWVGLGARCSGALMKLEAGGADGPAQGKLKRIHRVVFRFFQSVGLTLAPASPNGAVPSTSEPFFSSAYRMDTAIAPYSGDVPWTYEGTWDRDGQVTWYLDDPTPSNILMIQIQGNTEDGS